MGLAGRKQKQRIPNDPRNLSWADDAARFGQSYMSKLGWDPSKGLGASGEGMKSHLKVSQKLDMLGIGAAHQQDPHGIAWKQNKDFEALLKRLNTDDAQGSTSTPALGEFVRPERQVLDAHTDGEKVEEDGVSNQQSKKEKKRRRKDGEDGEDRKDKKKRKKEKRQHEDLEDSTAADSLKHTQVDSPAPSSPDTTTSTQTRPRGRPMAHRARIQAAKRLANKSAAAISEILGIAPTPSSVSPTTHTGSLTPVTPADSDLPLEKLTTSNKSVADYFKEKLGAKSGSNTPATNDYVSSSPRGTDFSSTPHNDDGQPRMGLGAGRKSEVEEDTDRPRIGIGGLSNTFAQFFAASSSSHATVVQMASTATQAIQHHVTTATSDEGYSGERETTEKQRRRAKKKEERKERNADEIPEVDVEVEKKKLKGVKRKTGGAEPSDLTLSTAVEEPEGGLESDSKRRREDKKKKRAKHDI
ncbi:hypothetical protein M405DRAFT_100397 [Rhizopogon salebrosus TDB-379]|nr:hypothetical protein M405DRAFT_100397 [Rhizopogon salebrosus TDB-379]